MYYNSTSEKNINKTDKQFLLYKQVRIIPLGNLRIGIFLSWKKKKDKIIALVQWFLVSEKPDVVGRIMDPTDVHVLISRPCKYVPLQGDIKIADEIKVAKQLTL